jgi:hypothetical protein
MESPPSSGFLSRSTRRQVRADHLRNLSGPFGASPSTGFWEWVLGDLREKNRMHVITSIDAQTGALLARNRI